MLTDWVTLFLINLAAVLSPGPDVLLVLRTGLREHRAAALAAVAGICTGLLFHVTYSVIGLALIITGSPVLSGALTLAGSSYLIWVGVQSIRAANRVSDDNSDLAPAALSPVAAFRTGFLTNVLNIKAMIFFFAVFSQVIKPETSVATKTLYGFTIIGTAAVCFTVLAFAASASTTRTLLGRWGGWIDRGAGVLFIGFAVSVLWREFGSSLL